MEWIEIIRLRMHQDKDRQVKIFLKAVFAELLEVPGLEKVDFYRNGSVPTDMGLHLSWRGPSAETHGSQLGVNISENLKDFGLLDHSIWVKEGTEAEAR